MSASILKDNFSLFEQMVDDLTKLPLLARSDINRHPALHFERLSASDKTLIVALAHFRFNAGHRLPDPRMVLRIYIDLRTIEAVSFQRESGFFSVESEHLQFDPKQFVFQNDFLHTWLRNCVALGHTFKGSQ